MDRSSNDGQMQDRSSNDGQAGEDVQKLLRNKNNNDGQKK